MIQEKNTNTLTLITLYLFLDILIILVFKHNYLNFQHRTCVYTCIEYVHVLYIENLNIFLVKKQNNKNTRTFFVNEILL